MSVNRLFFLILGFDHNFRMLNMFLNYIKISSFQIIKKIIFKEAFFPNVNAIIELEKTIYSYLIVLKKEFIIPFVYFYLFKAIYIKP